MDTKRVVTKIPMVKPSNPVSCHGRGETPEFSEADFDDGDLWLAYSLDLRISEWRTLHENGIVPQKP